MISRRNICALIFLGALAGAGSLRIHASETLDLSGLPLVVDDTFPADDYVRQQVRFWLEIYARTGEGEGWLHDPEFPELMFRKVAVPDAGRQGRHAVEEATRALQNDLRALIQSDSSKWTPEQHRLRALIPGHWDSTAVELCAQRLRFQRGLRDRFRQGLERSYRYLPVIDSAFAAQGVPVRLKYLPHVESSFYPNAYSKVGAAGMWQFMKSTGRKFLKVGYYVDERRDPTASTFAAAKMLLRCHELVKTWPLTVMAYNHGPDGVAKAVAATRSTEMGTVLQSYYSNTFGFASRNFYSEFLAASSLALLADSLFPDLDKWKPLQLQVRVLPKSMSARNVSERTGLSLADLEEYNLALRPTVFRGQAMLPKGYALNLPLDADTTWLRPVSPIIKVASNAPPESIAVPPADKAETRIARAEPATPPPAIAPKRGAALRPQEAPAKPPASPPSNPSLIPRSEPQSEALAANVVSKPIPPAPPAQAIVDSSFNLQLSDWEKVAHPWDRFQPSIYNLEHQYENGVLIVRVGPEETVSHFADWSGLSIATLRRDNHLRRAGDFRMNREIRLRLAPEAAETFLKHREEYFRGMEEDFYSHYHVETLEPKVVDKGTNVWNLAQERETPFWLFLKHNPGRQLDALKPGDTLMLPVVEEGWRHWAFTRYATTGEYFDGMRHFLNGPGETQ